MKTKQIPTTTHAEHRKIVNQYLDKGFTMQSCSPMGVQLTRKRSLRLSTAFLIVLGVLTLPLFGLGVLLWLLAAFNHYQAPSGSVFVLAPNE